MQTRVVTKCGLMLMVLLVIIIAGCGEDGPPDPKRTVISLFGAMEKNDQAQLAYLLDLPELMTTLNDDYALQSDSPRVITTPQEILDDLTHEGKTKTTWFKLQRVIGNTDLTSETTAEVEVTFVDKAKSKGYLTRFGLRFDNGRWKIYSFAMVSGR
jgi:hypothetical protein